MLNAAHETTAEITFATHGVLAIATLNRPAALNAQNLNMVRAFAKQLTIWERDPAITRLLIRGESGLNNKWAFCAGGDVKPLWRQSSEDRLAFFMHEYDLCAALKQTRLTTIAYMDGITMGGGVGLSIYANHRLATPRTRWAMPEVKLGFFLDIAASHFLNYVTEPTLGRYLALTGAQLSGADCLAAGIATNFIGEGQSNALIEALAEIDDAAAILQKFTMQTPETNLAQLDGLTVETPLAEFLAHIAAQGLLPDGQRDKLCALSLRVVDEALRRGCTQDYAATIAMDKVLVRHFLDGKTFPEGVRALLIDRDNQPNWGEAGLNTVDDAEVERYFAPIY